MNVIHFIHYIQQLHNVFIKNNIGIRSVHQGRLKDGFMGEPVGRLLGRLENELRGVNEPSRAEL